ncbi:MAG TPA: adenylyl-sulfate kinase [bacterium (Candidatus Stahlbacteria)]|nr:adenylyl-sulfate kinase [Candidatus Stahlbacteria bacterium]
MNQRGLTVWFTGLSSAGKSTLARMLEERLLERGMKVEVLDGDVVRNHLSKGLGFSKEDRDTNVRRIGFVCKLLSRNGIVAIAAAVSPYREIRDELRGEISDFVEVYVKCPLEELIRRNKNGLYQRALKGELKNLAGVDDPYEEPLRPEVIVETHKESPEESIQKILKTLELLGFIPSTEELEYPLWEEPLPEIYS